MKLIEFSLIIGLFFIVKNDTVAQEYDVEINYVRNDDQSVDFFYTKHVSGTYYLNLKLSNLDNAYSSGYDSEIYGKTGKLFTLKPSSPNKGIRFRYTYRFTRGELNPKFEKDFVYLFPFKEGSVVKIRELTNFNKKYLGKELPENWKAYQFIGNVSDTIYAARKGIVVELENIYEADTTLTYSMRGKTNYVLIEHKDGTLAKYAGFGKGNLLLKEGDKVFPRAPIGVLGKFDKTTSQLRFTLNYLSKFDPNADSEKRVQFGYIQPYFYSKDGSRKLVDKENFTSVVNPELVVLEMTKREKKRLKE